MTASKAIQTVGVSGSAVAPGTGSWFVDQHHSQLQTERHCESNRCEVPKMQKARKEMILWEREARQQRSQKSHTPD